MKRFMIAAIAVLAVALTPRAWADQCQSLTESQAQMAAAVLHVGEQYFNYCEPCGEKEPGRRDVVRSVRASGSGDDWSFSVNGELVDLAYIFFAPITGSAQFENLSKFTDCETSDVSIAVYVR